ncbi:MAG: molecular chaperone DnaK [Neolewinella sp.]|jgi:molecular chaperone DnaK
MARLKIDYGIDLGTTNSAISRMEDGKAVVKKSDTLKDTMPSCVAINKKKAFQVGDAAYNALKRSKLNALKGVSRKANVYNEFKRTMGTDEVYESTNLERSLTSEELSAEVLKTLKSFIKDEVFKSVVITVPAAFKTNQIDATRRAAEMAGFSHVEMLQEPVAAAMSFALGHKREDGFWMVFDFGGGTFDCALLKVDEGIIKVIDTEGDNYLGGKNLDQAIVDGIIMPYLKESYELTETLSDDGKLQTLRQAVKFFAEEAKIKMSFKDFHNILTDLGDIPMEDDEGEEIELDITISQDEMDMVLRPIFQKAVDICTDLLKRNNLDSNALEYLLLVGGPTMSPVIRKMLTEQIMAPDISIDPMTIVSGGAALYASTVDVSEEVREETRDTSKLQLDLGYEPSTVESEEWVSIKLLPEKSEGTIPDQVFVELERGDKAWSSGKQEINETGDLIETQLVTGQTNTFNVLAYDVQGNRVACEPASFTVIQGSVIGSATLPYSFGIELKQRISGKVAFAGIKGLEKNQPLPAKGVMNGLKTQKQIRPGMDEDFLKISLYQGSYGAEGTRAIYNDHVYDMLVRGSDLPSLLPENSDVDLTLNIDRSQNLTLSAFFPYLDHTVDLEVDKDRLQTVKEEWLDNELRKAKGSIQELRETGMHNDDANLDSVEKEIEEVEGDYTKDKSSVDNKSQTLSNLRKSLKKLDVISDAKEWPVLEQSIREELAKVELVQIEMGTEQTKPIVDDLKAKSEAVLRSKDVKLGNILLEQINSVFFQMTMIFQCVGFINHHDQQFEAYAWKDAGRARDLLDQGKRIVDTNPNVEQLQPLIVSLVALLPEDQKPSGDDTILTR